MDQWYIENPMLLSVEIEIMNKFFPNFKLDKLDDNRLYWYGKIRIKLPDGKNTREIELMAVYNKNHPCNIMGPSIRIYYVNPELDELINIYGRRISLRPDSTPFGICNQFNRDSDDNVFNGVWLHCAYANKQNTIPTAVSELRLHIAWLTINEFLVDSCKKESAWRWIELYEKHPEINTKIQMILHGEI